MQLRAALVSLFDYSKGRFKMVHDSKYFRHVETLEELKKQFHELCFKLHPDKGGTDAEFSAMRAEYEGLFRRVCDVHKAANGSAYEKATDETPEQFPALIESLLRLNVVVEVCGSWVWVGGDTRVVKDQLKTLGGKWSADKKRWYFAPSSKGRRRRGSGWSMDKIRDTYGSKEYERQETGIVPRR